MKLWPDQERIAGYAGGRMAVMAVPGSGKTTALAAIAARLIARGAGEILVVTYQNAAVTNLRRRINEFLDEQGLPPAGFHVATLHSLAYLVLSEHGQLFGLDDEPRVLSEEESSQQFALAAEAHFEQYQELWWGERPPSSAQAAEYLRQRKADFIRHVGRGFSRRVKYQLLAPKDIERILREARDPLSPLALGCWVYSEYQRRLDELQALDFDDLACQAYRLMVEYPDVVVEYQQRWRYILEDEAQDSVWLQEKMLELLAGQQDNWIRVGDPNQSIMSTFTSADPEGFRRFWHQAGVQQELLRQSARNSPAIASLANYLIDWTRRDHPVEVIRQAAFEPAEIQVVGEDGEALSSDPSWSDVKPDRQFTSFDQESQLIAGQWAHLGRRRQKLTAVVLVPTNWLGYQMADKIKATGLECDQLLESNPAVTLMIEVIGAAIGFLAQPHKSAELATLFERCVEADWWQLAPGGERTRISAVLRSDGQSLLLGRWPARSPELLSDLEEAARFAERAGKWLRASLLPIDELVATLVMDLALPDGIGSIGVELARYLGRLAREHSEFGLTEIAEHVKGLNARDILTTVGDSKGVVYNPRPGIITVTTYHRAKGLEWDLVYLTSLNEWHFPSEPGSRFFAEKAESDFAIHQAIAELGERLPADQVNQLAFPPEIEYIAERLRLLYVGITRAKKYLSMSHHSYRRAEDETSQRSTPPTLALKVLRRYVELKSRGAPAR